MLTKIAYHVTVHSYGDAEYTVSFDEEATLDQILDKVADFINEETVGLTPTRMYALLDDGNLTISPEPKS